MRRRMNWREVLLLVVPVAVLLLTFLPVGDAYLVSPLPEFFSPREKARRSSCQSNLKQMGLGLLQYTKDYDGKFPLNTNARSGWVQLMTIYTKSCPILMCPSEPTPPLFAPGAPGITDYWMNANLFDSTKRGIHTSSIELSARTILNGDGDGRVGTSDYTLNETTWSSNTSYANRHMGGANYSFADGHVKFIRSYLMESSKDCDPCCSPFYTFRIKSVKQ